MPNQRRQLMVQREQRQAGEQRQTLDDQHDRASKRYRRYQPRQERLQGECAVLQPAGASWIAGLPRSGVRPEVLRLIAGNYATQDKITLLCGKGEAKRPDAAISRVRQQSERVDRRSVKPGRNRLSRPIRSS